MSFTLFLTFHDQQSPALRLNDAEHARVVEIVNTTPQLRALANRASSAMSVYDT